MPHTTVSSGFFSGGVSYTTPLDGSTGHKPLKMHFVRAVAPVAEVPAEKPAEKPAKAKGKK